MGPKAASRTYTSPKADSMLRFSRIASPPKIPDQRYVARKYIQGDANAGRVVFKLSFILISPF